MRIDDKAANQCWELLGIDPAELERRYLEDQDQLVRAHQRGETMQYANTTIHYLVVETAYGDLRRRAALGCRLG
jgi:hypothetical protein